MSKATKAAKRAGLPGHVRVLAADVPLVRAAGGPVRRHRGRSYTVPLVANAVDVAKVVAAHSGKRPVDVLEAMCRARLVRRAGKAWAKSSWPVFAGVNGALARLLGVPIEIGPVRFAPDGRTEIAVQDGDWQEATDEVLRKLDAERRLGADVGLAHYAAEVLLKWREGHPTVAGLVHGGTSTALLLGERSFQYVLRTLADGSATVDTIVLSRDRPLPAASDVFTIATLRGRKP